MPSALCKPCALNKHHYDLTAKRIMVLYSSTLRAGELLENMFHFEMEKDDRTPISDHTAIHHQDLLHKQTL